MAGSMGVAPSLDAVSPEVADAFVAGLHRAFLLMGVLLVVGVIICAVIGEGPGNTPVEARPAGTSEPASR